MFNAYDVWDFGRPDSAREHLEDELAVPRFDPERDTWVVLADRGVIAGFAMVHGLHSSTAVDGFGRVHPDHHGRGVGSFIVSTAETRAREARAPSGRIQSWVAASDTGAAALLEGRGYTVVRRFLHMERDLDEAEPNPEPPRGVEIRGFRGGAEDRVLHHVLQTAFAGGWGFELEPFEEWRGARFGPAFDPNLVNLAFENGRPVGAIWSIRTPDVAWISELGVLPEARCRGIGGFLLRRAFADLARRGHREVRLNVDATDPTGATRLYVSAGMRVRREWLGYERSFAG